MNKKLKVEGVGNLTITDKHYLASGGQADVYAVDKLALKIYHTPDDMISINKIRELQKIKDPNVLGPKHVIFDNSNPVGFAMDFKKNTTPLCKLFTSSFCRQEGVTNDMVTDLVRKMQITGRNIHNAGCLIVDWNEMNVVVSPRYKIPFFIDVDSYKTPSFKADAIMESIRDRQITGNNWTKESDWFSFAILAFQMWIGIHPYKGSHPDYKLKEWAKRMEDGVSVFDKDAKLPGAARDFSLIPGSHLEWFKEIFLKNKRLAPPAISDVVGVQAIPQQFRIVSSTRDFGIEITETITDTVIDVFNYLGVNYFVTNSGLFKGSARLNNRAHNCKKIMFCGSDANVPIVAKLQEESVVFEEHTGDEIGKISAEDMMVRNNCVYTKYKGRLVENSFNRIGNRTIHGTRIAANTMESSTQVFDGVVYQNMLGKANISVPYKKGRCSMVMVSELNGYRVLGGKGERNVCVFIGEKSGKYDRLVLIFNEDFTKYSIRITEDVSIGEVNFTVLPNGVAVLATESQVEIFKDDKVKIIDNPPFSTNNKLFNYSGGVHYVDGDTVYSVTMK